MIRTLKFTVLALLALIGMASLSPTPSLAATQDYRFELVDQTIKMGHNVPINVRLVNTTTGKPVLDATITGQKLNMLMGTMTMPAQVKAAAPDASGTYRFNGDTTMAGDWQLDLVAKIPGESEPYLAMLKFQVVK